MVVVGRKVEAVVSCDNLGQILELVSPGYGKGEESRLGDLPDVLIGGAASFLGIGSGVAFCIDDVENPAIGARGGRGRIPARGNEAENAWFVSGDVNDRDAVR